MNVVLIYIYSLLSPSLRSGEESERALQELHLPLSAADRQAQPLLRRQAALRGRDQQRDGREAHLQSRCGNGDCLNTVKRDEAPILMVSLKCHTTKYFHCNLCYIAI